MKANRTLRFAGGALISTWVDIKTEGSLLLEPTRGSFSSDLGPKALRFKVLLDSRGETVGDVIPPLQWDNPCDGGEFVGVGDVGFP